MIWFGCFRFENQQIKKRVFNLPLSETKRIFILKNKYLLIIGGLKIPRHRVCILLNEVCILLNET